MNNTISPTDTTGPPNESSLYHIALCSLGLAVGAMAVCGNILNVLVLSRLANVTDTYRLLLIALAVTDFCAGLTSFSYLIYSIQTDPDNFHAHDGFWCRFTGYVITVMSLNDVAVVMCVAIYKYITITKPLRYSLYLTTRRAAVVVLSLFIWLVVKIGFYSTGEHILDRSSYQKYFGVCLVNFGEPTLLNWTIIVFSLDIYLPIVVVCFLYGHIAIIARRQAKRIAISSTVSCDSRGIELSNRNNNTVTSRNTVNGWKGLRSALLLTFGFIIAWIPFTVVFLLLASEKAKFNQVSITISGNLVMSTTWWNYIIYSLSSAEFRNTAFALLENTWQKVKFWRKI